MTSETVHPEDGVARYIYDRTQGPACAIAAGAATIYRNYCVPVDGRTGQTTDHQLDALHDMGSALSAHLGRPVVACHDEGTTVLPSAWDRVVLGRGAVW